MQRSMLSCVGVAMLLSACGEAPTSKSAAAPVAIAAPEGAHTVVVLATDSLRAPFQALAARYEADHPGAVVQLRCEGGAQLLAALQGGTAADVVAIGDSSQMSRFAAAGLLASSSPAELARNRIAIAVAAGNPDRIQSLHDLARPDVRVGIGRRSSSIGRYGRWVLSRRTEEVAPRLEADTASGLVARIVAGEIDAAIVYATSCRDVPGVEAIAVPESDNTPVLYSISATREAAEPRGAAAFRALAVSPVGQQILAEHGFLPAGAKSL